jgi:hypothetical protein
MKIMGVGRRCRVPIHAPTPMVGQVLAPYGLATGILAGAGKTNDFRLDGVFADYGTRVRLPSRFKLGHYHFFHTDEASHYRWLGRQWPGGHQTVNHSAGEYVLHSIW